ncbi:MAG: hypothetical protein ACREM1_23005, partial [Longimicrobiales bacterium]
HRSSAVSLRPATAADVPNLTELVHAAYRPYVGRLDGPPRPMSDGYGEVVRTYRVTLADLCYDHQSARRVKNACRAGMLG